MAGTIIRKKKVLSLLVLLTFTLALFCGAITAAAANTALKDLTGHWAQDTLQAMVDAEEIGGYPDGTFKPNNNITRAEFATLLVRVFALEAGAGTVFDDTAEHWAKKAIATASHHQLVSGYSDSAFGPDDPVTREQIAVMISNATQAEPAAEVKTFTDSAAIAPWAKGAVEKATAAGLIAGYPDGTFRPKANATRAEAAVVLDRGRKPAEEILPTTYDRAGTYGPATGTAAIDGDVVINAAGVVLQNTLIKGNLTISEKVGAGDVTLNSVTVTGTTLIRGGGKDSIHINGGQYAQVVIENTPGGNIRLVAVDAKGIELLISAKAAGENIILEGTFANVAIKADNIILSTRGKAAIDKIAVHKNLTGITINIAKDTTVKEIVLDSATKIDNAKDTVLKFSGAQLAGSTIAEDPPETPPPGGGGGVVPPKQDNSDTYFDALWNKFENTVNAQAQKTDPQGMLKVQLDLGNKKVKIKILDSYHPKGITAIAFGTGLKKAITDLLSSEMITKVSSAGQVIETRDSNGNKKTEEIIEDEAIGLAFNWLGDKDIFTPLEDFLIGETIEIILYGYKNGEIRESYYLYFY